MLRRLLISVLAVLLLAVGGCRSVSQAYPGYPQDTVWQAMVAAAKAPVYEDWVLVQNEVWQSPEEQRLEIYRRLERDVTTNQVGSYRHETRDWRLQVIMSEIEPPTAVFRSRGWSVPVWAGIEAERYFAQVDDLLGPPPPRTEMVETIVEIEPAPPADVIPPAAEPMVEPEAVPDAPPAVDIDEINPG